MTAMQIGTPRVNCLDCLDRTNLVMSELARRVLTWQMEAFGLSGDWASSRPVVDRLFKEVCFSLLLSLVAIHCRMATNQSNRFKAWANNGDAISQQYAGTSALKGDFTRTGRRNM